MVAKEKTIPCSWASCVISSEFALQCQELAHRDGGI